MLLKSKPVCAVCNRPVDSVTEERDEVLGRVVFTARCHGDSQRVVLDEEVAGHTRSITMGSAFGDAPRGLPAPNLTRALPEAGC